MLPDRHDVFGNKYVGDAGKREQLLGECEPAANSLAWKKKGPPGCTVRLTVNLHVSGSATDVSARIVIVSPRGKTSNIVHHLGGEALPEGPQVLH